MAGGPSGPALVVAASRAGHFAQLAAGYKTAAAMMAEVRAVREAGVDQFGVNLFVPNPHPVAPEIYAAYARSLLPTATRLSFTEAWAALREDDDDWSEKISALRSEPVPVVSFTFGLPDSADIDALHDVGTIVIQTVTSPAEARISEQAGIDVLVVQGSAAGGHSAIWDANQFPGDIPLPELVAQVASTVGLPLVAAGGIATAADVHASLAAGAAAVAVGTAVIRAVESGASVLHKNALADPQFTETAVTRAFTGRLARALVNDFVRDHDTDAVSGYPAIHHLTRPLRAHATAAGDPSVLNLWAGQGWQSSREAPVAAILAGLLRE